MVISVYLCDRSRRIVDECVTMCRKPKGCYLNDAQWDVNGIRYEVSGFSAMSLRIGQLKPT